MGSAEEEEAGAELELGLELEVADVDDEGPPPGWLEEAAGSPEEETSDGEGDPDKEESTGLLPWPQAKSNVDMHKVSSARFLLVFMSTIIDWLALLVKELAMPKGSAFRVVFSLTCPRLQA